MTVGRLADPLTDPSPYARIMFMVVVSLVLALLAPVAPVVEPCVDVQVIGARGSGQAPGFGEQVAPVVEVVETTLAVTGRSVDAVPLAYPALSLADSFGLALFTGEYEASVRSGADALLALMAETASVCPTTEFVLIGYSQGAQAIKAALEDQAPGPRIAGVVLLADPTRDHEQAGIVRLGDPTVERPGAFGAVALPDHVRAVTIDVCAAGDGVCERGRSGLAAHTRGYDDAGEAVAVRLLAEVEDRLSQPAIR